MILSDNIENVFCIGIGGIGISALARYWKNAGKNVAGYDIQQTPLTQKLESEAIDIFYTDDINLIPPHFITTKTLVVRTPAVPDNLEVLKIWAKHNIKVLRRAEMLALIASKHQVYAVAGTHGKTTVTTMLSHLLNQRSEGVNSFMGGISRNYGTNILFASTNDMVIEADEYDRAFLNLTPQMAVITSIEADHLDIYQNIENIQLAFNHFTKLVKHEGIIILKKGITINTPHNIRTLTYHQSDADADYSAKNTKIANGCYCFDLATPQGLIEEIELGVPGNFNFENSIAASALALNAGLSTEMLRTGLKTFKGVERRFEQHTFGAETYIDDYAHHPAEIKACIESIRKMYPGRTITAIFQPHLYSRTRDFNDDFVKTLNLPDKTVVTDIYPAREKPIDGITGENLAMQLNKGIYVPFAQLTEYVETNRFDILVTMGAGSIGGKSLNFKQIIDKRT